MVSSIYIGWGEIVSILLFTVVVEHIFLYFNKNRDFYFSYSSISTAVGVMVLMYSPHLYIYFVVIALALFQKHFLLFNQKYLTQKHFFNPSNFALIMALLFFYRDAHIISGQFGDEIWLAMVVFVVALIMLIRVNRWIISLVFLISYLALQYYLMVGYDPVLTFEDIYRRLYSVTFMLFIYFMLTDPPVTPSKWYWQIGFGFFVALFATLLDRFYGFRVQHLFMVVFFLSFWVRIFSLNNIKKQEIKQGVIILLFTVGVLGYIEMQEPYYFEMNG